MTKLCVPLHDCLDREMRDKHYTSEQVEQIVSESTQLGAHYRSHPAVRERGAGDPLVVPYGIYLDGVRYTRQIGSGRAQSLLLFTVINLLTMKRHLLGVFHKGRMCRCGCRSGMCTLYPFFLFLKWTCVAAATGFRPGSRHDGPFAPNDYFAEQVGQALLAKYVLVELRGDLVEFTSTLGFPSFGSVFSPCIFCWCSKDLLHYYSDLNLDQECWPLPQDLSLIHI